MRFPGFLLAVLAFTAASAAQTMSAPAPAPAVSAPATALTALNDAFRAAYADAKTRVLASKGPTLVVNGDRFSLLYDARRLDADVAPPIYDTLKTIAHIPLAIYVALTPGDGAIPADRLETLAGLRQLIP